MVAKRLRHTGRDDPSLGRRHRLGLPGDGINGIMDALRKRQSDIRFV
jgi:hypothetical protein